MHGLTTSDDLVAWLERKNQTLSKRTKDEWATSGRLGSKNAARNALSKAREHGLFLGLGGGLGGGGERLKDGTDAAKASNATQK